MFKIIRYWIPVLFIFFGIFFLSSLPPDQVNELSFLDFPYSDKFGHFAIYLVLGFSIGRALTWRIRDRPPSWVLYRSAIGLSILIGTLYGIADEFHQSFVPGRDVELLDAIADTLGSTAGAFLTILYRQWIAH